MFPGHLLLRVPQVEPHLKLATCDYDWLYNFLTNSPSALAHHSEDGGLVLTAETRDLQKFVLQHSRELFKESKDCVRLTNSIAAVSGLTP